MRVSRRSFFAAVGAAIVASRAARLEAGGGARPQDAGDLVQGTAYMPATSAGSLIDAGFFRVGDILTFGGDPRDWVVTALGSENVQLRPVGAVPLPIAALLGPAAARVGAFGSRLLRRA